MSEKTFRLDNLVRTSYSKEDVVVLLKDLSLDMQEMSTEEREKAIQSGVHYSEMLPQEKAPSKEYEALYEKALQDKTHEIAIGIVVVSEMMLKQTVNTDGKKPIIVSLARAGIPVGILMKRYIKEQYNIDCKHYAISIIRDKGVDINAMEYIYKEAVVADNNVVDNIFFVDGWTGKGAIKTQLEEAVAGLKMINSKWDNLKDDLYVLADPANITKYCGTHADYLLPSACLNSTVSGLTSRTILNSFVDVAAGDFHGAVYFKRFEVLDKSKEFIDTISSKFKYLDSISFSTSELKGNSGMEIVNNICDNFGVSDYKKVKPGIGETTRVLLRRLPWKVLVNSNIKNKNNRDIEHILLLCKEKNVSIEYYDLGNYKVCGIIKELSADA